MNYLAHAYLSFNHPPILAGNMISDFVKGKKQYDFSHDIQKGIKLHRAIDSFTDAHPAIHEMKKPFRENYGLYAGAFVDIICDYYLANDKNEFNNAGKLASFSRQVYTELDKQAGILPPAFRQMFVYMKQHDWLYNYQFEWLIEKSFTGIVNRAKYMTDATTVFTIFQKNIDTLRPYYAEFFPLLKNHAKLTLEMLGNND